MDEALKYWPIFMGFIGLAAWAFRLEAKVKQTEETLVQFYATKQEVAKVSGSVDGLSQQIADVKLGNQRIESKVDALLVAKAGGGQRTGG